MLTEFACPGRGEGREFEQAPWELWRPRLRFVASSY